MEKKIRYPNSQDDELVGILTRGEANKCVIFCHGFMGDKDENTLFSSLSKAFSEEEIGSFRFDFSGCGETDMQPLSLQRMKNDLKKTEDLIEKIGFEKVYFLGHSLGCVPVIEHGDMSEHNILLSPYYKPDNRRITMLSEEFEDGENILTMKNRFGAEHQLSLSFLDEMKYTDTREKLRDISNKTSIILSEKDEIMPDSYYEEILEIKKVFSDIIKIDSNHFYDKNRKNLFDAIISIIKEKE